MEQPAEAKGKAGDKFKIVFLGDQAVGKSCIIRRFLNDSFVEDYSVSTLPRQPVGDSGNRRADEDSAAGGADGQAAALGHCGPGAFQELDTHIHQAGKCGNHRLRYHQYAKSDIGGVEKATFEAVKQWLQEVKTYKGEDVKIAIVGNKADMKEARHVIGEVTQE